MAEWAKAAALLDSQVGAVRAHVGGARVAIAALVDHSANDPRLTTLMRKADMLWHQMIAADFLAAELIDEWTNFKRQHPPDG